MPGVSDGDKEMIYTTAGNVLVAICLANAILHIVAEWRQWEIIRLFSKLAASAAFVMLAIANGAAHSTYGRFIMVALIFSSLGDALLLSLRSTFLLAGIAAFFFAHVTFAAAFATLRIETAWLIVSLVVTLAAGLAFLRWLWKYLRPFYKIAVPVYLAAITIMTSLAISVSALSQSPLLAIGAIIFAASDVSVARNRFVERKIVNKVWGLPLYYAAQLLFAASVLSHG